MTTLKKYNLDGKEIGTLKANKTFDKAEANSQMIKDYIVALRKNARQWSANTKGRAEVRHTTAKPYKQKGTGRARHGNLVGPQFRGGGIVFGPKPKFDQHVRRNKKERIAAMRYLISEKIANHKVIIIEDTFLDAPKTKTVTNFLKAIGINKRILFLGEGNYQEIEVGETTQQVNVKCDKHLNFSKSIRNLPKIEFSFAKNVNGYDLMLAEHLIVTEAAFKELSDWLA